MAGKSKITQTNLKADCRIKKEWQTRKRLIKRVWFSTFYRLQMACRLHRNWFVQG